MTKPDSAVITAPPVDLPDWALRRINLADARLGAHPLDCSDEFFASSKRMLPAEPACFYPGMHDENGKWMDGWETRRRRDAGNDWCIIELGCSGNITGFDLDTSFFTGNYPLAALIEACPQGEDPKGTTWVNLTDRIPLRGNAHHWVKALEHPPLVFSHVRLNIYPDGGIARLRVYGQPVQTNSAATGGELIDLAAVKNGGRAEAWNDAHYGHPNNLLLPGDSLNTGDGWETRRRREPGNDWCILALGAVGEIVRAHVDTMHFKGNFPRACSLQAAYAPGLDAAALVAQSLFWKPLIPEMPLSADRVHEFPVSPLGAISHVRFNIFPDGGVSRLRLWGKAVEIPS